MNQKSTILQFLAFILVPIGLYAQPVITLEDYTPKYGSTATIMNVEYLSPGSAGENQIWDFSDIQGTESYDLMFSSPSGFFGSDKFPEATHIHSLNGKGMMATLYTKYDGNEVRSLGIVDENSDYIDVYNSLQLMFPFPLEFNAAFEENWNDTIESNQYSSRVSMGSCTFLVDGYGTLKSPAGTFEDVLRIRKEIENLFITTTSGDEKKSTTTQISYSFIKAGFPVPLLSLTEHKYGGESIANAEYYVGGKARTE